MSESAMPADPGQQPDANTPTSPQGGPSSTWKVVAISLAILLLLGGGGGAALYFKHQSDVAAEAKAAKKRAAERQKAEEARERREAAAAELAAQQAVIDGCRTEMAEFLEKLSAVDARLNVGLDLDEYADLVGDASVAYDGIDLTVVEKEERCVIAGSRLENAFNKYAAMASRWNDCVFEDDFCDLDSIDPVLQRNWSQASRAIDRAKSELDGMEPQPASAGTT